MSAQPKKVIPATPLYQRYRCFKYTTKGERRAQAEYFAGAPRELARHFGASVTHFETYDNVEESFIDKEHRVSSPTPGPAKDTKEIANRVAAAGTVVPHDPAGGRKGPPPAAPVTAPTAKDMAFDYVERELAITRTTNGVWEHGPAGASRLDLDLLLAAHGDRTPIAAEVKIADDADRYYALIQTLAAVASLATPKQCERMRRHLNDRGGFPETLVQAPRLDLYLVFVDSHIRGAVQTRIERAVDELAAQLLRFNAVAWSVRRLVGLEVASADGFDARVRFAYERAERPLTPFG